MFPGSYFAGRLQAGALGASHPVGTLPQGASARGRCASIKSADEATEKGPLRGLFLRLYMSEPDAGLGVMRLSQIGSSKMAEQRETYDCIASDKVEGTAVYGPDREKIGSIERIMIGKRSGKVTTRF